MRTWRSGSAWGLTGPAPAPRSTRRAPCINRWRPSSASLRKNQPVWQRDTNGLNKSSRPKKPKTNVIAPQSPLLIGPGRSGGRLYVRAERKFGASGEYLVDEVTRNPHPPEEVSGRREAAQGCSDRGHDRRIRPYRGRARPRDQDRTGTCRHPRSRPFRLSDLCQGRDRPAREPPPVGRRAESPARRRQSHAGRGVRGAQEGRDARRARPRARKGRGECPRAGRTRPHRRHALYRRRRARVNLNSALSAAPMRAPFSFAGYFLPLASIFVFICASSLFSFANADLSAAISARAAARSRPAAAILSWVSRASLVSAC